MSMAADRTPDASADAARLIRLSQVRKGMKGVVVQVGGAQSPGAGAEHAAELERRLLEIGFVEGARVEVLHEGFIGRDPIAIRLDEARVALRRREAEAIVVQIEP